MNTKDKTKNRTHGLKTEGRKVKAQIKNSIKVPDPEIVD